MAPPQQHFKRRLGGIERGKAGDALFGGGAADAKAVPQGDAPAGDGVDDAVHRPVVDDIEHVGVPLVQLLTYRRYRQPRLLNHGGRALGSVELIANLAKVDKDNKFDEIFTKYYGMLGDKGTILTAYVAVNSGKIARAKPHLREKITDLLLDIDRVYRGKQVELIKGSIVEAFSEYFEESENKERIKEFVGSQLYSGSPKSKKLAKAFLEKWD